MRPFLPVAESSPILHAKSSLGNDLEHIYSQGMVAASPSGSQLARSDSREHPSTCAPAPSHRGDHRALARFERLTW